jgi:hypothetical protein
MTIDMYFTNLIFQVMKRITILLLSILSFTACTNDALNVVPDDEPQKEAQQLKLFMPDADEVNVYSTATVSECYIDKLWVLVFNGTTLRYDTLFNGISLINNGQATQLVPQLKDTIRMNERVVCIANSGITTLPTGLLYSNVNEKFPLTKSYYKGGDPLPMYGEAIWGSSYTVTLTRAVAKIQVRMGPNVSDITGNFTDSTVTWKPYNYAVAGYVQPPTTFQGIQGSANVRTAEYFNLMQKPNATEQQTNAYIYEYPSQTREINSPTDVDKKTWKPNRVAILLKKTPAATPGDSSFYRLDFFNDTIYLNTYRNNHYIFTITKIRSEGYTGTNGSTHALALPGSNIEYTVNVDDGMNFVTSNGQYAIVSSVDTAYITADPGSKDIGSIRYINQTGIAFPSGITNTIAFTGITGVSLSSSTSLTPSNQPITLGKTGSTTGTGYITCTLGNIKHVIVVKTL